MNIKYLQDNEQNNSDQEKDNKDSDPDNKFNLPNSDGDNGFNWNNASKTSLMWIIIIVSSFLLFSVMGFNSGEEKKISYPQYRQLLENDNIAEAHIEGKKFHGKVKEPQELTINNKQVSVEEFVVTLPLIENEMLNKWREKGIDINYEEAGKSWTDYIVSFLPWILIIGVWIFFLKKMQGGGKSKGIFGFGKNKATLWTTNKPDTTFDDVAGCDEAKEELEEIIDFLKDPEKFRSLGGEIPKGALLVGKPGTGKTLLAKAAAGESGVPFFSITGSDFVEMFVGVGASRVRDLFKQGKKNSPCIIFIDEIDAIGRERGAGVGGGHDEREQTLNQLLSEMDGFDENSDVILLAATNRPDVLDKALLRPGRFDRQIVVDAPDIKGRKGILEVHTRDLPISDDVNLEILAKGTPGLVGADLENMANEAALIAAKREKECIEMEDFEDAKDKIMMGKERKSMVIPEDEKKLTAYHEAGHTLVTMKTDKADPLHKVTIIPRGRAMGITHQIPLDDRHNYSKSYIESKLEILLGGRASEQLIFDELSTGGGNDIDQATKLARKMVCQWGMSEKLGPLTFGKNKEEVFLGKEISQQQDFSDNTAEEIDNEVKRIVRKAEKRAKKILKENEDALERIAEELMEHETLTKNDIQKILDGEELVKTEEEDKEVQKDNKEECKQSEDNSVEEKEEKDAEKVDSE